MTETEVKDYWRTHNGTPEWHPSEWVHQEEDWETAFE